MMRGVADIDTKGENPFAKGTGKNDKPVGEGKKTAGKLKCRFCTADATKRVRRADSPTGVGACDKHVPLAKAAGKRVLGVDTLDDDDSDGGKGGKSEKKSVPGEEGSVGPFPGEYTRAHVYARDVQSGAGNCVCGAAPGDELHARSPLGPTVEGKAGKPGGPPKVAGLALIAADTGRVLMLQRAFNTPDDPAAGTWEFPGGHLEAGDDSSLHGAMREWAEEVGHPVPTGGTVVTAWTDPSGIYQGHAVVVPSETALDLSAARTITNPDDDSEQVAWWDVAHAAKNPALRRECRNVPWRELARIAGQARTGMVEAKAAEPPARDPEARRQRLANQAAAAAREDAAKGGKKKRVASEAGSARYKLPIGAEIGKARDQAAAKVQQDPAARSAYGKLLTANPREYRAMLDGMKDDELGRLTQVAYSFRSSNPNVVQARLALAAALRRRGKDVADYGGLGSRATKDPDARPARKATLPAGARGLTQGADGSVDVSDENIPKAKIDALLKAGWTAKPGDGREALYPPPAGQHKSLPIPLRSDGTWLPGEAWRARAERRTMAGLMGKALPPPEMVRYGEGGQPMRLHVYVDGSWQYKVGGGGELVAGGGYPVGVDPLRLAAEIESKVMSPDPAAARLREYWAHGAGRRKWRPGSPGDFKRLKRLVARHIPKHMLNGWVANVHKLATGEWPGRKAHGTKADPAWEDLSPDDLVAASMLDPDDPTGRGPDTDAISTALDRYADIAGQLTAEQEYEAALAAEVQWELLSDGSILAEDAGMPDDEPGYWDRGDDEDPDPVAMLTELFADAL
jgi:8-oxo-dGTP pyrophosphatase MutT (NUDIX family)